MRTTPGRRIVIVSGSHPRRGSPLSRHRRQPASACESADDAVSVVAAVVPYGGDQPGRRERAGLLLAEAENPRRIGGRHPADRPERVWAVARVDAAAPGELFDLLPIDRVATAGPPSELAGPMRARTSPVGQCRIRAASPTQIGSPRTANCWTSDSFNLRALLRGPYAGRSPRPIRF